MRVRIVWIGVLIVACSAGASAQIDRKALQRADSLVRAGKPAEAVAIVDAQIARNRGNAQLLVMRGTIQLSQGNFDRAKADFQSSLAIDPEIVDSYLGLASIDIRQENPRLAISRLNAAIDIDKNNARAWAMRAEAKRALQEYAAASPDYAAAVKLDPKNAELHAARGLNEILRGNTNDAVASLNRAIELTPNVAVLYGLRARAYASANRMEEALPDMTRSIELGTTGPDVFVTRGAILNQLGRHTEAIADFDRALTLDPTSVGAIYNRSLARYAAEDMDGSCADTRRAIELVEQSGRDREFLESLRASLRDHCDSTVMSYFYQRGIAAYNSNDFAAAIAHYNRGLAKFPGSPMLIMFRGNAALAKGDFADAIEDYEYVVTNIDTGIAQMGENMRVPTTTGDERERLKANVLVTVLGSAADAWTRLGRKEEALATFDRAVIASAGTQPALRITIHNSRGILRMLNGNYEGAISDFDEILKLDPKVSGAHTARAIAYYNSAQSTPITVLTAGATRPEGAVGNTILFSPVRPTITSREKAEEATKAAARAVETGPASDQAFLIRGYLRWALDGSTSGCVDLQKAKELGSQDAEALMEVICR